MFKGCCGTPGTGKRRAKAAAAAGPAPLAKVQKMSRRDTDSVGDDLPMPAAAAPPRQREEAPAGAGEGATAPQPVGPGSSAGPPPAIGGLSAATQLQQPDKASTGPPVLVVMRHSIRLDTERPADDWADKASRPYDSPIADVRLPVAAAALLRPYSIGAGGCTLAARMAQLRSCVPPFAPVSNT